MTPSLQLTAVHLPVEQQYPAAAPPIPGADSFFDKQFFKTLFHRNRRMMLIVRLFPCVFVDKMGGVWYNDVINERSNRGDWMSVETVSDVSTLASALREQIRIVVRGAEQTVDLLIAASLCGGHVLLEDLPGSGKTTLAKAYAKASGCVMRRIQCTPDLMPADITGYPMLQAQSDGSREMVFRKGAVFTNVLLADEINRAAPRTQAGLLECMAEGQVSSDGVTYALPRPFLVIATQNPIELHGTFPLPEAQLDRFIMRLAMGQPAREQELAILEARQLTDPLDAVQAVTDADAICAAQAVVRTVEASSAVLQYLLSLAEATRRHSNVRFGLSTRAVLAVRHAAQAIAAMQGRSYLLPDDVKAVFPAVCCHRLHVGSHSVSDAKAAEQIVQELLSSVEVPK